MSKMSKKEKDGGLKYVTGLLIVTALRLVPRIPNMEPIMATAMPFSKGYGWIRGAGFAMLAIVLYDIVTRTAGTWTLITAMTYALVTAAAYLYLRNKPNTIKSYVKYAIFGTIFYDVVTGIGMGYFLFKMPLIVVITGQIPFTLMHLASSMLTAAASPSIYKWVVANPELTFENVIQRFVSLTK